MLFEPSVILCTNVQINIGNTYRIVITMKAKKRHENKKSVSIAGEASRATNMHPD